MSLTFSSIILGMLAFIIVFIVQEAIWAARRSDQNKEQVKKISEALNKIENYLAGKKD